MKSFCEDAINKLRICPINNWAEMFVSLKLKFFRLHQQQLVCSTYHGINFFNNLLDGINGKIWKPLDDKGNEIKGKYEDNFRKLINIGLRTLE